MLQYLQFSTTSKACQWLFTPMGSMLFLGLTIIWTVYKSESKTNQHKFMIIVIQQNILDTCVIRSWSQVRDVHNHPCMYIVPNVWDNDCNYNHAWRSSLLFECTGMGMTQQSQQAPLKTLDMNGWTHSSFWWLWFTCNSLTSAHTRSSVISSLLRL